MSLVVAKGILKNAKTDRTKGDNWNMNSSVFSSEINSRRIEKDKYQRINTPGAYRGLRDILYMKSKSWKYCGFLFFKSPCPRDCGKQVIYCLLGWFKEECWPAV